MKKVLGFFILVVVAALFTTGCENYKRVTYFQNIDSISFAASKGLYDARIMPKDLLSIYVSTIDPRASQPFNLGRNSQSGNNMGMGGIQYLVDNDGCINFPVLGRLKVLGLTIRETEQFIADKVKPYLSATENAIVIVRMSSFRVVFLGEIGGKVLTFDREKVSIVEAIAAAGDMSMYGKRNNILLIREDNRGQKSIHRYNMNDAEIFNDPYYYLQQNDIIYVEPNNAKRRQALLDPSITGIMGYASSILAFATLIYTLFKK